MAKLSGGSSRRLSRICPVRQQQQWMGGGGGGWESGRADGTFDPPAGALDVGFHGNGRARHVCGRGEDPWTDTIRNKDLMMLF